MGVQMSCQTAPLPMPVSPPSKRRRRKSKVNLVASNSNRDFFGPERWSSKILSRNSQESTIEDKLREEELSIARPSLEGIEDSNSDDSEETEKERWVIVDEMGEIDEDDIDDEDDVDDEDSFDDEEDYIPPRKSMRLNDEENVEQITNNLILLEKDHSLDSVEEEEFRKSISRVSRHTKNSGLDNWPRNSQYSNDRYHLTNNFEVRMNNERKTIQEEMSRFSRKTVNEEGPRRSEAMFRNTYIDEEEEQYLPSKKRMWEYSQNDVETTSIRSSFAPRDIEGKKSYWLMGTDGRISQYNEIEKPSKESSEEIVNDNEPVRNSRYDTDNKKERQICCSTKNTEKRQSQINSVQQNDNVRNISRKSTNIENKNFEEPSKRRYLTLNKNESNEENTVNNNEPSRYTRSIVKRYDLDKRSEEKFRRSMKNSKKDDLHVSKKSIKADKSKTAINNSKIPERPPKYRYLLLNKQHSEEDVDEDNINEEEARKSLIDEIKKRKIMLISTMRKKDNDRNGRKKSHSFRSSGSEETTRKSADMKKESFEDTDSEQISPNIKKRKFFGWFFGKKNGSSDDLENDDLNRSSSSSIGFDEKPLITLKNKNKNKKRITQSRSSKTSPITNMERRQSHVSKELAESNRSSIETTRRDSQINENESSSCWFSRKKRNKNSEDEEQYTLSENNIKRRSIDVPVKQRDKTIRESIRQGRHSTLKGDEATNSQDIRRRKRMIALLMTEKNQNRANEQESRPSKRATRRNIKVYSKENKPEEYTQSKRVTKRNIKVYTKESEPEEYPQQKSNTKRNIKVYTKESDPRRSKQENNKNTGKKSKFRLLLLSKENNEEEKVPNIPTTSRHTKYRYNMEASGKSYQDSMKEEEERLSKGFKKKNSQ